MPSADSIWQDLQRSFKEELNPASYSAWIETANVLSFEKNQLLIPYHLQFSLCFSLVK